MTQNTNINIRVSKELKENFIKVAKNKKLSYSKLLRNYMREYIKNNG